MSKRKRRKSERESAPVVSGPFAATYWHLRRLVRRRTLFVLFDGDPQAPRLTFFDTTRGLALLDYWPCSRLWAYADRPGCRGKCKAHAEILAVAVRRAGQCRKADKSQLQAAVLVGFPGALPRSP
jgi:hypothetical protein